MALITVTELTKKLKAKDFDNLYYFYGHDVGALEAYAKGLVKTLCPDEAQFMNLHSFDGKKPDIAGIADACLALPMMAERVVVTINDLDIDAAAKSDADDLRKILADIPETTTVIIYATAVDLYRNKRSLKDKNKRFCDFCAKHGTCCEFAYKRVSDVGRSIVSALAREGASISRQDADYLADCCLCDTAYVRQEIQKLSAYAKSKPEGKLTREDIDALCIKKIESDGFALALNILRSNAEMVFNRLKELSEQNMEAFEINAVISFSMTDLYRAKLARASGRSWQDCAQAFKYPKNREFAVKNAYAECANMTCERIRQAIKIFCDADEKLKTHSQGSSGDMLTLEQACAQAMSLRS